MPDGPVRAISRDAIALILAIGLATALNLITVAVLYDAVLNPDSAGLSENATQILTGWGGGIIGILGAVFGYRAGAQQTQDTQDARDTEQP
jgi:hypothetical protein